MSPVLRNVLAVIAGLFIGGLVNMGLVMGLANVFPPPAGVDPTDPESIKASMHLYEFKHFIAPLLGHALGTLIGAFVAVKIAASQHKGIALGIGVFYLVGGILAVIMMGGPLWFKIVDLTLAYIPMALLAYKFGAPKSYT